MTQLELLTAPQARRTDPETSHAAAESARELATRHQFLIIEALRFKDSGKDAIARRTGLSGVAVARRLPELERQGKVKPTGRTVKSNTGRSEREWCAI